jgi:hypothetical protein
MREIKESDWKILRQVHTLALERFCQLVLTEVQGVQHDQAQSAYQKYLAIYEIMRRRNKEMALIFDDLRRSTALTQLTAMRSRGLLTEDEFARFSEETRSIIGMLLTR